MSTTRMVPCTACGAMNRVPATRLVDNPVCGRCKAPLLEGKPIPLDAQSFAGVVERGDLPVLVDFFASWCGPCHAMAPAFDAAAAELAGEVRFAKVDIDAAPEIAQRFGIQSVPTLVRFQGGRETARKAGALPRQQIRALARG